MEKDPVCGMYLIKVDEKLKSEYRGEVFYFCCPCCKAKFDLNPGKYLKKEKALKKFHTANNGDTDYV